MRATWNDLRYAIRSLLRQRLLATACLATLALGIGANSAIFAVLNVALLRPLPYRDPGRLVIIEEVIGKLTPDGAPVTPSATVEFQRNTHVFDSVGAFTFITRDLTGIGPPERLRGLRASAGVFQALGVIPAAGRVFTSAEDRPDSGVAVISYELWQRRFGADPGMIGRVVNFDRKPVTIIGVLPADFEFPLPGIPFAGGRDFWVPMGFTPQELSSSSYNYELVARMKPSITLSAAQADAQSVTRRIYEKLPPRVQALATLDARVKPLTGMIGQNSRRLLWLLVGAVGLVLLIACVNVANLLLSRASGRERELAIRSSLGARRARLLRQLLTESVVLGIAGGAVGLLVAAWLMTALVRFIPPSVPRAASVDLDWRVVAFTAATAVVTGLLFGMIPAFAGTRASESARLKEASRGATPARNRLRGLLVVSEVAFSFVLLAGAGLLARSLIALRSVNPGFNAEHVLTAQVAVPPADYPTGASIQNFYQQAVEALAALPGATAAGAATSPLLNLARQNLFTIKSGDFPSDLSSHAWVLGNYFQALGIPLRRGRLFDSRDRPGSEPALMINETMARRYFPGQDPIGQQIKMGSRESPDPWYTVVGVVADVKNNGLANAVKPQTYAAYPQLEGPLATGLGRSLVLTVRSANESGSLAADLRAAVARLDPQLPVTNVQTTRALLEDSLTPQRFQTGLVGAFAGLALLLAAVGIYAVVSYAMTQRTPEIGLRMALGASRTSVLRLAISQGMWFVLAGMALGLAMSLALTRTLTGFLFGVKPIDPWTFALSSVILFAVALAANFAPARRASSVDPVVALRYE
jgi:putative ABC transport system permease protein